MFNSRTAREEVLATAASEMIGACEALLHHLALPAARVIRSALLQFGADPIVK